MHSPNRLRRRGIGHPDLLPFTGQLVACVHNNNNNSKTSIRRHENVSAAGTCHSRAPMYARWSQSLVRGRRGSLIVAVDRVAPQKSEILRFHARHRFTSADSVKGLWRGERRMAFWSEFSWRVKKLSRVFEV